MAQRSTRRSGRWLLITLGLLGLVLVLGWIFVNPTRIAERVKEKALPQISERLGREVTAGPVHVRLWPVGVSLDDLAVAGGPGEPPLLQVGDTRVGVKLWPLIRSRGRDVEVSAVELQKVRINLVRRANGTWSYEDIGGNTSTEGTPAKTPAREVTIGWLRLQDGTLNIFDGAVKGKPSVAVSHIDFEAHDLKPGQPALLRFKAALASDRQNLGAKISVDPLPAHAADLKAGHWPTVTGGLELDAAQLRRLADVLPASLSQIISRGEATVRLRFSTPSPGTYAVSGDGDLKDLALRGSPANGSLKMSATFNANHPGVRTARFDDLQLHGPGLDLRGTASMSGQPRHIQFTIDGSQLDLSNLMASKPAATEEKAPGEPLVPPSLRSRLASTRVDGTIHLAEIRSGKLRAHDLQAQASLEKGLLTLKEATVGLYSGRATLSGTTVNLLETVPVWNTKVRLEAVSMQSALQEITGSSPVTGLLAGEMNLTGRGNDWAQLQTNLAGDGQVSLANGQLATDLDSQIAQPLTTALQALGVKGSGVGAAQKAGTALQDLSASFSVQNGFVDMKQPLHVRTSFGELLLGGKLGLDQRLALKGAATLSHDFLARLGVGNVVGAQGLEVPMSLGGTLEHPAIEGVDWSRVAQAAIAGAVGKDLEKTLRDQAEKQLKGLLQGT